MSLHAYQYNHFNMKLKSELPHKLVSNFVRFKENVYIM